MRPFYKEIAGIDNFRDITRGYIQGMGMYIPTQDSILLLKSGGDLNLYEAVAQDDRVKSCLQQRFAGLISKDVEVLPGGEKRIDKQAAEWLNAQVNELNWDDITEKMLWGVFYGYSVAEVIWKPDGDKIGIADILVRNRRRFQFGIDKQPKLISFDAPLGEDLPEQKFWHFCVGADHHDEPYGRGLAHWLYWLTWFKRNDLKWWITFLENFADPSTVGTYPAGATEAEKRTLEGAVRSLGKAKWAIKPEGMLIELVEASRSGTADYQAMYDTINTAISQVILSQSMTTENGSSLAQAQVHQDVGDSVIKSDADLIASSFNNSVVKWLMAWNFPDAAIPKCYRKLEAEPDLKAMAEKDKIIVDMGFPANPEYIVETYGEGFKPVEEPKPISLNPGELTAFISLITQAQQGGWSPEMVRTSLQISFPHLSDALLDKMSASMKDAKAPGVNPNNPQAVAGQTAQMAAPDSFAPDLVDNYVDKLKQQFPFKPWLQQAKELLMQSPNLEDYSAKLVDLYPEMPSDDFNQIMLDALTAASMVGYFDAGAPTPTVPVAPSPLPGGDLEGEAEFKLPEGSTRRRNGVDYVLQGSRWHRAEVQEETRKKNLDILETVLSTS